MSNICRGLVHTYLCDFEIVCISFFQLYLTFHTYGQYILYPWGYARRDAVDKKDLHRMGKIGANAAKRVSGHKYSVGSAAKMLYPAAGISIFFSQKYELDGEFSNCHEKVQIILFFIFLAADI